LETLAAAPPWPLAREVAVAGRCRGALLRDWAAHVERRGGSDAVARLRERVGIGPELLPDAPKFDGWYPVGYQIALTRAIVDVALDGDILALEPLLAEDATRFRDRLLEMAMRALGPKRLLKRTAKAHAWLYEGGQAEAEVGDGAAVISFRGAAFFANPTWRVLQIFATRGMLRGFGRDITKLQADAEGEDRFTLEVAWR